MALEIALQGAGELGVETRILDLGNYDLTFVDGRDTPYPAGVQRLRERYARSEWHHHRYT